MRQHLFDIEALLDVPVQHAPDEVDALVTNGVRDAQVAVHDLVDAVEWVLLVDDGVEENAQRPYVLFLAAVRLATEDFWGGVVWDGSVSRVKS